MVLSQTSVLGKLAGVTRRVTLVTGPVYSTSTGSWLVNGLDADKQQWQIDLTALPVGVTKDHIKAGQQWFIERGTTYNRLFKYVGEFVIQNQIRMSTTLPSLPENSWTDVTFDTYMTTQSGVAGITTYNDGTFNVPFPGMYSVTSYLTTVSGTILSRIYSPVLKGNYPISNYTTTELICLTSGNLSVNIQGNPTATSQITGFASITYAGPIIPG